MNDAAPEAVDEAGFRTLVGERLGPYQSFNPVSAVQVWQWCAAMGERSPLFCDAAYRERTEFAGGGVVAPPAMMQVWTMRDINDEYAPGSTSAHPYPVMRELERLGFHANVAISYDIRFHRYLVEGDRAHHYKTVVDISPLKTTAIGEGYFFTDRMEYLDQNGELFAEALITYFQYRPIAQEDAATSSAAQAGSPAPADWRTDYTELDPATLAIGTELPPLVIPVTHRLIVGGAIACQDYVDVHHNAPAARAAGMPDIFMNILTTSGLSARYLGDWAGPASRLATLKFRLMAPNTPGDSLRFSGRVTALEPTDRGTLVEVDFSGVNSIGPHLIGSASLMLANSNTQH